MHSPRFGAVITAMVTPFSADGSLDLDAAASLARFLAANGSDGLVVAGSTGEGTSLTNDEKCALIAAVAEAVTIPVLAGTTSSNTADSVALTARAHELGASGILATTPAYVRPSQQGIAAHLGAVAEATTLPVMLYDIPVRTGRKIGAATTVAIVESHTNVVALKDASGELVPAAGLKATLGDTFDLYSGDDGLTLPFIALGACGVVSVASHWIGPEMNAMVSAATSGDWARARALNAALLPSYVFESSDMYPNPVPTKAAMRALGHAVGQCRLPLGPSDDTLDAQAQSLVNGVLSNRG